MCGDGANDCGALKAAHTGISLSEAESSVASPFTSKNPTIGCVPRVIKEGRCALVTSFGIFKYMAAYSLTQFVSVMILYSIDSNLTDIEFLYIDLFMISVFAFFFGKTEAFSGPLVKQKPLNSLMSLSPVLSLILQMLLVIGFQMTAFFHIINEPWYVPFDGAHKPDKNSVGCNENYAIFSISSFQYIILAIVFSKGAPYRKSIFSNYGFMISCVLMTAFTIYLTLIPYEAIANFMDLVVTDSFRFRLYIVIYGLLHFLLAVFVEVVIVEYLFFNKLRPRWHNIHKSRRKFLAIEDHLRRETRWPPLCEHYVEQSNNTSVQNSPTYSSISVEKKVQVPLDTNNVLNNFFVKESNVHETVDNNLNITPSCGLEMLVKPTGNELSKRSDNNSSDISIIMQASCLNGKYQNICDDTLIKNKHYKITNGMDNVIKRYGYEMSHLPTS